MIFENNYCLGKAFNHLIRITIKMKNNYYTILITFSVLLLVINLSTLTDIKAQKGVEPPVDVNLTSSFENSSTNFMITFLDPTTNTVQSHVDYDFYFIDNMVNQTIYKGSAATNQDLLHTSEGRVTIPYKFTKPGNYLLNIDILGLHFMPIPPKTFSFPLTVSEDLLATIEQTP